LLQRKNIYILEVDRQCPYGTNFVNIAESTNVADTEASMWTTVTASQDTSPREVLRTASVPADQLARIEATVITACSKIHQGNSIGTAVSKNLLW